MSYRTATYKGASFVLAQIAATMVTLIAILWAPYALFTGSFWGANLGLLLLQIAEGSLIPLCSIPIAFAKASTLDARGRHRTAAALRFFPVIVQFLIAPATIFVTGRLWQVLT